MNNTDSLILNKPDRESMLTLELLQAIEAQNDISQRHLARELGVALGLANAYLKRCVKKGLIKIKTAPANRYLYYLTPRGFAEKARLSGKFLSTSLALFRQAGDAYSFEFNACLRRAKRRLIFVGISNLTEIAYMRSLQSDVDIVGVFQPNSSQNRFFDLPIFTDIQAIESNDAFIFTSMEETRELIELLERHIQTDKIVVPGLLLNISYRTR